jgi:predicted transposase/invertase (TIGR01784 family)
MFRWLTGDRATQEDLLRLAFPDLLPALDLTTITPVDAGFAGGQQADLLLSLEDTAGKRQLVYILMEHKSYRDPVVAVQLHRYVGSVWQREWIALAPAERGELPVVHPVVFYHGVQPWNVPASLTTLHGIDAMWQRGRSGVGDRERYPVELHYRLLDLNHLETEGMKLRARTLAFLITLRYVLHPLKPEEARAVITALFDPRIERSVRLELFRYLFDTAPERNTDLLLSTIERVGYTDVEGGRTVMTMAQELIRRGREAGREEGREEGAREAVEDVARRMKASGYTLPEITAVTGLSEDEIAAL